MQGITAEYVRLQTGRPNNRLPKRKNVPQLRFCGIKEESVRFFLPSERLFGFRFFHGEYENTRQGCRKAIALIQKEATKQWQQQKARKSVSD